MLLHVFLQEGVLFSAKFHFSIFWFPDLRSRSAVCSSCRSPVCVTENSKSSRIAIESQPWQKGQSIHFQEAVSVIVHWSFNRPKHRSKTAHGFRCCSSNLRLEIQDQSNNWQLIRSHLPWISIDFRLIQLTTRNTKLNSGLMTKNQWLTMKITLDFEICKQ